MRPMQTAGRHIKVFGAGKVLRKLNRIERKSKSALVVGMTKGMFLIEREAVKLISFGDLRAVDTGRLRSTLGSAITNVTAFKVEGSVYAGTKYAMIVHEGWGNQPKPRPFLRKAAHRKFYRVVKVVGDHMRKYYQVPK